MVVRDLRRRASLGSSIASLPGAAAASEEDSEEASIDAKTTKRRMRAASHRQLPAGPGPKLMIICRIIPSPASGFGPVNSSSKLLADVAPSMCASR